MRNVLFYLITVLIWGSTWMGIKMQLGQVDPMVSVFYRFALASLILLVWCRLRRLPMRYRLARRIGAARIYEAREPLSRPPPRAPGPP